MAVTVLVRQLTVVCLLLTSLAALASGESFFLSRDHTDRLRYMRTQNRNQVATELDAAAMLEKYGYLRCKMQRRRRRDVYALDNLWEMLPTAPDSRRPDACGEAAIREAVREYQKTYKLPQTGVVDEATKTMMSETRCGNRDDEQKLQPTENATLAAAADSNSRHFVQKRAAARHGPSKLRSLLIPQLRTSDAEVTLRRRRWADEHMRELESGAHDERARRSLERVRELRRTRRKRSAVLGMDTGDAFNRRIVTWRLVDTGYSTQMTINKQRTALGLAFRMWSEVIPVVFMEDKQSPIDEVDIKLAFGKGEHLNCPNKFDGYGGQLSHAWRQGDIHLDDDEYFTVGSNQGTNLLKVAVHEIGHVLGLAHTSRNYSIMYAIYQKLIPNANFELGWEDRKEVQALYGVCSGKFDTVFDWIRRRPDGQFIYNTYMFRNNRYWMYENRYNRTRYGDPLKIEPEWKGLESNIDGYAHVWTYTENTVYFFKGHQYWKYDSENDKVFEKYPRNISEDFRAPPGSNSPSIPNNIDTVFFDRRDGNLYFFKGDKVYGYEVAKGHEGSCLPGFPKMIRDEYPPSPGSKPLPNHPDAVYYSYTDTAMYILKNNEFWINEAFHPLDRLRTNSVKGPFPMSKKWYDICDVDSEL
ncbi:PREDICTED: matrix metalloproteinase-21-like [Priapulus caudatus]|uniref:Matrix metalloproteinase-21-like n=1 Tax=Priapulus caudatus TaxID=37621 RepID=A0ABM1F6T2_PRICU|nr:PREDICTED: matrix metalloproteinase-21-like [Priapulus caudatus]